MMDSGPVPAYLATVNLSGTVLTGTGAQALPEARPDLQITR
jgi:hypothetical protein